MNDWHGPEAREYVLRAWFVVGIWDYREGSAQVYIAPGNLSAPIGSAYRFALYLDSKAFVAFGINIACNEFHIPESMKSLLGDGIFFRRFRHYRITFRGRLKVKRQNRNCIINGKEIYYTESVKEQASVRKSFNELADKTFGLSFENWYRLGYWRE